MIDTNAYAADLDEFRLGSPFWKGIGSENRLWTPEYGENVDRFVDAVLATEPGQQLKQMFPDGDDFNDAWQTVLSVHQNASNYYGSEISVGSFVKCLRDALRTKKLVAPEPVTPELTADEATGAEWAEYYKTRTLQESRDRAKRDPQYAIFLQSMATDAFNEHLDTGGVTVLNRPDNAGPASAAVREFAEDYNRTSATATRPMGGFVTLASGTKYPWAKFQTLLAAATQARLV